MFTRNQNGAVVMTPTDCEDIARFAEKHDVTVSFITLGLKLEKRSHTLRGTVQSSKIVPWTIFQLRCPPVEAIKADILTLAAEIEAAKNDPRKLRF